MPEPKTRRIPRPIWLGVTAVVMVVLAVFVSIWLPYQREQLVIREIERLGGRVGTEWDGPEWIGSGPEWVQDIIAGGWLSWFDRVRSVLFWPSAISDERLNHLSGLTNLEFLDLQYTQITDEGLKHLSGLTKLEQLYLDGTQVSDEGLKHLSGLTKLYILVLKNTQVTDEGVKELQKSLPDCEIFR